MPPDAPPLHWQAFHQTKRGQADVEYEDAFAGDPASGRFAIADGATEASFAGIWARVLVEGFVAVPGQPWRNLDWLAPLRQRWSQQVDKLELPWYAEAKREQGAYATFLGLAFRPARRDQLGSWQALAVGDSCLFHVRGDHFLTSFPITESTEFGSLPPLIRSRPPAPRRREATTEKAHGRWRPGDRFLLMTDALALWFLRQHEHQREPLVSIDLLLAEKAPQEAFAGWVEERRDREHLRDDDITLVVIDLAAPAPEAANNKPGD